MSNLYTLDASNPDRFFELDMTAILRKPLPTEDEKEMSIVIRNNLRENVLFSLEEALALIDRMSTEYPGMLNEQFYNTLNYYQHSSTFGRLIEGSLVSFISSSYDLLTPFTGMRGIKTGFYYKYAEGSLRYVFLYINVDDSIYTQ